MGEIAFWPPGVALRRQGHIFYISHKRTMAMIRQSWITGVHILFQKVRTYEAATQLDLIIALSLFQMGSNQGCKWQYLIENEHACFPKLR